VPKRAFESSGLIRGIMTEKLKKSIERDEIRGVWDLYHVRHILILEHKPLLWVVYGIGVNW